MSGPEDWLQGLVELARPTDVDAPVRLATVASTHVTGSNPRLVFDGETAASAKAYPRLQDVRAGDRVLCVRAGSSYVVVAALGAAGPLSLRAPDERAASGGTPNPAPSAYYGRARTVTARFVNSTDVDLAATTSGDTSTYVQVLTFSPWSDGSGGPPQQLAMQQGGRVWHRVAVSDSAWGPWKPLTGRAPRGAIHRSTGQTLPAGAETYLQFTNNGGPFGDGITMDPWAETYPDRATYPERLRLPAGAPTGLYVAQLNVPLDLAANQTADVLIRAFSSTGAGKGQPVAVDRRYINTATTWLVNLTSRPTLMAGGDWFAASVTPTVASTYSGGYHVNGYLMAHRVSDP